MDDIESQIAKLDGSLIDPKSTVEQENSKSPVLSYKGPLKRKIDINSNNNVKKEGSHDNNNGVIYVSDSDCETHIKQTYEGTKKQKLEAVCEEPQKQLLKENDIKNENDLELEAFNVKQEYLGYDEPIQIDSESDSESEQWLLRLSQSSPGKPFIKMAKSPKSKPEVKQDDSSYSQLDDFVCMNNLIFEDDGELYEDDIISVPQLSEHKSDEILDKETAEILQEVTNVNNENELEEFSDDIISIADPMLLYKTDQSNKGPSVDEADGFTNKVPKEMHSINKSAVNDTTKRTQLIKPRAHSTKGRNHSVSEGMYIFLSTFFTKFLTWWTLNIRSTNIEFLI